MEQTTQASQKGSKLEAGVSYQIAVIGLGLIGGSMAMALRGFRNARIVGVDVDADTIKKALALGTIDQAYPNAADAVKDADLVILCVAPHRILSIMDHCQGHWKEGSVITDVCGTKTQLYREMAPLLPDQADYIGIHPMAGREKNGFDNAEKQLFLDAGLIITPLVGTKPESLELMKQLAVHIGTNRFTVADPALHDDIIAYTSDLMHISATALCEQYHPQMTSVYTAGAFRDCTRVAWINPELWTDLLLTNANYVIPHLDRYIKTLSAMRSAMVDGDGKTLFDMLDTASHNKKEMLQR